MATYTRINGLGATAGLTYSPNCNLLVIRVRSGAEATPSLALPVNLFTSSTTVGGAVELILQEVNPLAYMVETGAAGNIHVVVDQNITPEELQHRIRSLGANTAPVRSTGIWSANSFTYSNTFTGADHLDISSTGVYYANVINGAGFKVTSKDGEPN